MYWHTLSGLGAYSLVTRILMYVVRMGFKPYFLNPSVVDVLMLSLSLLSHAVWSSTHSLITFFFICESWIYWLQH